MNIAKGENGKIEIGMGGPQGDRNPDTPIRCVVLMEHVGDGGPASASTEREPQRVTGATLPAFMKHAQVALDIDVPDILSGQPDQRIGMRLEFEKVSDFDPRAVAEKLPGGADLLRLRSQLTDLRRSLGNAAVRRRVEACLVECTARLSAGAEDGTDAGAPARDEGASSNQGDDR